MSRYSLLDPRVGRGAVAALIALCAITSPSSAQTLREIGKTAAGNPVLVEPRTVKRAGDMLDATVRVKFAKAVKAPGGDWWGSRTRLTFDCSKRQVKVLENWYYTDTSFSGVASHTTPGTPAFGTVMGGSMTSVAYDALCPTR